MTVWWRRNRLWLALLLPLLLLALSASAFRLTTLYLPWQWSRPTVAGGPSGTLTQNFLGVDGERRTRTVTVRVAELVPADAVGEDAAAPGAQLWRLTLDFEAAPDQIINGCTIELASADGVRYGTAGGRVAADPADRFWMASAPTCVPEGAEGPSDWFKPRPSDAPRPAANPRPPRWSVVVPVALPEGVRPATVRVMWKKPDLLVLTPPA